MSDYYKIDFDLSPKNTDAADLLAAFIADIGFESFEATPQGLTAYIQSQHWDKARLDETISDFPMEVTISWKKELIPHQDWNSEWEKKYFQPLVLGEGRCVIHSSFHKDYPEAGIDIVIDPKMAFGTGHHATTSMMASYLFEQNIRGKRVIDMGTGTGILAIIAKKLHSGYTIGVEIDPDAYENAFENIALNSVEVVLLLGDASELKGLQPADFFLANINRNIILQDLSRYIGAIKPGAQLILSGFYYDDVPILEKALNENGMDIVEVKTEGDSQWASIRSVKN